MRLLALSVAAMVLTNAAQAAPRGRVLTESETKLCAMQIMETMIVAFAVEKSGVPADLLESYGKVDAFDPGEFNISPEVDKKLAGQNFQAMTEDAMAMKVATIEGIIAGSTDKLAAANRLTNNAFAALEKSCVYE